MPISSCRLRLMSTPSLEPPPPHYHRGNISHESPPLSSPLSTCFVFPARRGSGVCVGHGSTRIAGRCRYSSACCKVRKDWCSLLLNPSTWAFASLCHGHLVSITDVVRGYLDKEGCSLPCPEDATGPASPDCVEFCAHFCEHSSGERFGLAFGCQLSILDVYGGTTGVC